MKAALRKTRRPRVPKRGHAVKNLRVGRKRRPRPGELDAAKAAKMLGWEPSPQDEVWIRSRDYETKPCEWCIGTMIGVQVDYRARSGPNAWEQRWPSSDAAERWTIETSLHGTVQRKPEDVLPMLEAVFLSEGEAARFEELQETAVPEGRLAALLEGGSDA